MRVHDAKTRRGLLQHAQGWRVLRDDACIYFATDSFAKDVELVDAIGQLAAAGDRHADI